MKIRTSKVIAALAAGVCALAISSAQAASPITAPGTVDPLILNALFGGGSVVQSLLNAPIVGGDVTGTLSTWVIAGGADDPTGYTFVYQVKNTGAAGGASVGAVGIGVFAGFGPLAVGNNQSGGTSLAGNSGILAENATLDPTGTTVTFGFEFATVLGTAYTQVAPGQSSDYLVVETSGTSWKDSTASIANNVGATAADLAPAPVVVTTPDGGCTLMLLGSALSGLALLRRKLS